MYSPLRSQQVNTILSRTINYSTWNSSLNMYSNWNSKWSLVLNSGKFGRVQVWGRQRSIRNSLFFTSDMMREVQGMYRTASSHRRSKWFTVGPRDWLFLVKPIVRKFKIRIHSRSRGTHPLLLPHNVRFIQEVNFRTRYAPPGFYPWCKMYSGNIVWQRFCKLAIFRVLHIEFCSVAAYLTLADA